MSGTLLGLLVAESALTVAGILLFIYRGMLEFKEEDTLVLDDASSHLMAGQAAIHRKANKIGAALKYIVIAWAVLGLALFGVWVAEGLNLM